MFQILRKELKALVKDRRAMMLGLLMPIILISVFSLAFGGMNKGSDSKTDLLVSDEDNSPISKQVVKDVDSIKTLNVVHTTTDSAIDLVKKGKYPSALIFHKGFSDSVKAFKYFPWELKSDPSQSFQNQMVMGYLIGNLSRDISKMIGSQMAVAAGADEMNQPSNMGNSGFMDKLEKIMRIESSPVIKQEDNSGIVQAVAGTAVMMLMFSLTAMGGRLLEEKENGTLKRLLCSPLTTGGILSGKMMASISFAVIQLLIMFSFSSSVFGLVLVPKLAAVLLLIVATAFACSSFGMFLAAIVKSRDQLQSLSTLAILSMSVIGGSMVPSFLMPSWMQSVGHVSINYWSIQGFFDIFQRQLPITDPVFLEKVGVLILFGLVLSTAAFRLFRKNVMSMA